MKLKDLISKEIGNGNTINKIKFYKCFEDYLEIWDEDSEYNEHLLCDIGVLDDEVLGNYDVVRGKDFNHLLEVELNDSPQYDVGFANEEQGNMFICINDTKMFGEINLDIFWDEGDDNAVNVTMSTFDFDMIRRVYKIMKEMKGKD